MPDDVNELVVCHQASSASSRNLENLRNLTTERLKVLLERLLKKVDESLPSDTDTPSANRHLAKRTVYWTSWADRWKPVSSSSS
ncbi:hypothetical protein CSUI_009697 [Cystoisospora suis]|uniref:Uncharacterized protein n=1 Tax=Cystoisospora suis TaxID=483139 RepID=A0A2C6KG29_9APIC|nr:hypothetical protein CSUI_009697 [Cystoisospora suis]